MLGKSGTYYRAGYLARQANDWPDGTDEQEGETPNDIFVQTASSPHVSPQDSTAAPVIQHDASLESPQFSGVFPFTSPQMPVFIPLMQSQKTENALPPNDSGRQTTAYGVGTSAVSASPPTNLQKAQGPHWPVPFGAPQPFNEDTQGQFKIPSLLPSSMPSFRPSPIGQPANANTVQRPQTNHFANSLPSSPSTLSSLGSPDTWASQNASSPSRLSAWTSSFYPVTSDGSAQNFLTLSSAPRFNFPMSSDQNPSLEGTANRPAPRSQSAVSSSNTPSTSPNGMKKQVQSASSQGSPQVQPKPLTPTSLAAIARAPMSPEQRTAFTNAVITAASRHGLDPNLLVGLAQEESSLNSENSPDNQARGLFQIRHPRQQDLGVSDDTIKSVDNIVEPVADYLSKSVQRLGGNTDLAIGSWNRGVSGIRRIDNGGGAQGVRDLVIYTDPKTHKQTLLGRDYIDKVKSYSR